MSFLAAVFQYTFSQSSVEGFSSCLEAWRVFVEVMEDIPEYAVTISNQDIVTVFLPHGATYTASESFKVGWFRFQNR